MTVYNWFTDRANLATEQAQNAVNVRQANFYLSESDQWERRAGVLTVEQGSQLVEEVVLWRLIEECDFKLKGKVPV